MADEDTKEEVEVAAPAAEPASGDVSIDKLKPVPRPDKNEHEEKKKAIDTKISEKKARSKAITDMLNNPPSESPEVAAAKEIFSKAESKSKGIHIELQRLISEGNTWKRTFDDLKKSRDALNKQYRGVNTLEDCEARIKSLEHQQQTSSLTMKEEKEILEAIKKLEKELKPTLKELDLLMAQKGKQKSDTDGKRAELQAAKEEEEKAKEKLDAAKKKDVAKKIDIPSLKKERDGIRKDIDELNKEMKKLRDDFSEKNREWRDYQNAVREQKQKEWKERQEARQKEYEEQKRLYEEEEAKRDPWEEEKVICEQLIEFCKKYLPKAEEVKEEKFEAAAPEKGLTVLKKADLDDNDKYGGLIKAKKGKKKGGGAAAAAGGPSAEAPAKAVKIKYAPEDLSIWDKLSIKPPLMSDECVATHAALLEKREWLKTAPPKPKKKTKEEKAAEEKAAEKGKGDDKAAGAEGEPEFDAAAYKKQEAEELKAKQEAERKKAAEKEKLEAENLKRMQELEGSGKKVAGGMHKFDASEVDVHGGAATADDFMDAFGF